MESPKFDPELTKLARRIQKNVRETDIMKVARDIHFRTGIPAKVDQIHASILARNNGVVSPEEISQVLKRNKR